MIVIIYQENSNNQTRHYELFDGNAEEAAKYAWKKYGIRFLEVEFINTDCFLERNSDLPQT
jgi:hypothetical protein